MEENEYSPKLSDKQTSSTEQNSSSKASKTRQESSGNKEDKKPSGDSDPAPLSLKESIEFTEN